MRKILALITAVVVVPLVLYALVSRDKQASHSNLAAAELPPLIPVRDFHASLDAEWDHKISDDGQWISWRRASAFGEEIAVAPVAAMDRPATIREKAIADHFFLPDGRLGIVVDGRVWAMPPDNPGKTSRQDVTSRGHDFINYFDIAADGAMVAMGNDRYPAFADVYRHDANGGSRILAEKNPGDVVSWLVDGTKHVFLRVRVGEDGLRTTEFRASPEEDWTTLRSHALNEVFRPITAPLPGNVIQAISDRGRDKSVLVEVPLSNHDVDSRETVIAEFADADISDAVVLSASGKGPVDIARSSWGYRTAKALTPRGALFLRLVTDGNDRVDWHINSASRTREIFLVNRSINQAPWEYVLVDLHEETARVVDSYHFGRKHADKLTQSTPIMFSARDGREIPALLTRPKTKPDPGPLPAVVLAHGGPPGMDAWGYDHTAQFLANRGYVVLSVNYRGSTGFGRAFLEAGFRQFGRAMQDDIADGAKWLAAQGIADPKAIAVMGESFGGYMALMAVSRDPGLFKVAIAHAAVSDLVYQQSNNPHAWGLQPDRMARYFGSLDNEQDRAALAAYSPINLVDQVHGPILMTHGKSDPIVGFEQTEAYAAALARAGKPHTAHYFENEGHVYRRWQTKVQLLRDTEHFLARHLGGRDGGYDYVELAVKYF